MTRKSFCVLAATRAALLVACAAGLLGCAAPQATFPLLIERNALVEQHIGCLVTLRGRLTVAKQTSLLGVAVSNEHPDNNGAWAIATGVLRVYDVPVERDLSKAISGRKGRYIALMEPHALNHSARAVILARQVPETAGEVGDRR